MTVDSLYWLDRVLILYFFGRNVDIALTKKACCPIGIYKTLY